MSIFYFKVSGRPIPWKRTNEFKGRKITDKAMISHQRMIARIAGEAWGWNPPLFGAVKFCIIATFETPASWPKDIKAAALRGEIYVDRDPDFDNIAKEIADAVKFVTFCDDNQIGDGRCILRYGSGERTEIWIEPLSQAGFVTPSQKAREAKWRKGGYDPAIAAAPCGRDRWPRVIDAMNRERLL